MGADKGLGMQGLYQMGGGPGEERAPFHSIHRVAHWPTSLHTLSPWARGEGYYMLAWPTVWAKSGPGIDFVKTKDAPDWRKFNLAHWWPILAHTVGHPFSTCRTWWPILGGPHGPPQMRLNAGDRFF